MTLRADDLTLAYGRHVVVDRLTVEVPPGRITVIVGANACGKSTLLAALARLLAPKHGAVTLDGRSIHSQPTRQVARSIGLLPQSPVAPGGITVVDLVTRGRSPHQNWWRQWSEEDEQAVERALAATGMAEHRNRPVDELSGGQRQRAWIAMAIAQDTPLLLLDEPTTFLDLAHQIDVLDTVVDLNRTEGRTVVMVLHDLNQACRYADHLIAMRDGAIVREGPPGAVVDAELIRTVFAVECQVSADPVTGTPMIVPMGRHHRVEAPKEESAAGPRP
ncbi:ABC-type cobalamin/Fe3+-siderophore transport system, ATPase component [Cryptosporangium arvum DSM 44712]|uniref:ABC-type cobalamin/Fe3+-siderophore transport system, ATPase component n=1 Tax=Cryptosporangium arvum DSM 44712 TaxID=927661 RepID=A0A010ZSJ2_9ACTN|nr:ABC transporter ATP-binding protein [Cryptosporangium arvum]EXG81664.1 ABC-type cobalamin/Fe3+-siderophore transport system, ATPase component [Cryptosporangium arvum DSM 44712]